MFRVLLMVAVVFAFLALPVAASPLDARLNVSHACTIPNGATELHFVLVQSPDVDYTGTAVQFSVTLDNGPAFTGTAPFFSRTGGTAHFVTYLAPATTATVASATLTVAGMTYTLSNPGVTLTTYLCQPLGVVIETFTATCVRGGVKLDWESNTEIGVMVWTLARNATPIATIPAQYPGAPIGAVYTYTDIVSPGSYQYTLDWGDGAQANVTAFCNPTGVRLSRFTAK